MKLSKEESFALLCGYIGQFRDDSIESLLILAQQKQNINAVVSFTIPKTGWGTDNSVPSYPYYLDVSVTGLLATDIVDVNIAPASALVASAAEFVGTESYAGKFRLRCKNIPTAAISAEYHITNTVSYSIS